MKTAQIKTLTSVRGLAAWGVVYFHFLNYFPTAWSSSAAVKAISHANVAVDLFFILSGFVISLSYTDLFAKFSLKSLRDFAIARFSRVYPLHFVMLLAFVAYVAAIYVVQGALPSGAEFDLRYLALSFLMIQNWGFTPALGWNVPAWSISTEFGAYLVFPIAALAFNSIVKTRTAALAGMLLIMATIAAVFWRFGEVSIVEAIPKLGLFRCIAEFLIGMLLYQFALLFRRPKVGEQLCLIGAAAALVAAGYAFQWRDYIFIPVALTALVYALLCEKGPLSRTLSLPWLVFLGDISYSTYLCHYLIKRVVAVVVTDPDQIGVAPVLIYTAAVVAASILLYRFIELPSRKVIRAMAGDPGRWRLEKAGRASA